jgi:hypothetical protein
MSLKDYEEDYWDDLLSDIQAGNCTPIIGEGVSASYIPPSGEIASKWAEKYGYPLQDSYQLSRVAQYLAIENPDKGAEEYPKRALKREIGSIKPPDFSTKELENTTYAVLADLNLPIYITTNYDLFMEAALKAKGKSPVSEFCRWNKISGIPSVFNVDEKYTPRPERPLVYHVYGLYELRGEYRPDLDGRNMDLPRSLALTEKDYIDFALEISKDEKILPTQIYDALSLTSLLLIGYDLHDISFRVFFQGIIKTQSKPRGTILSVQLQPKQAVNPDQAMTYLRRYTAFMFGAVRVYWGDPCNFCKDLRQRRENFKKK